MFFTLGPDCSDDVVQESKFLDRLLLDWCAFGVPIVLQKLTVTWYVLMYDLKVDGKYEDPNKINRVMKDSLEPGGKMVTFGIVMKVVVELLKINLIVKIDKNVAELHRAMELCLAPGMGSIEIVMKFQYVVNEVGMFAQAGSR